MLKAVTNAQYNFIAVTFHCSHASSRTLAGLDAKSLGHAQAQLQAEVFT